MGKRVCKDCATHFDIEEKEIEFYQSKNMSLPLRCKPCRDKRRIASGGPKKSGYRGYTGADKTIRDFMRKLVLTVVIPLALVVQGLKFIFPST